MHRSHITFKIITLTSIGFIAPVVLLLPVDYALSEFGSHPDWQTVLERYLPPCIGCSLLFLASAITSSTRRQVVTFVQSMLLHFVTFIVCVFAFSPIQHLKSTAPQPGPSDYIPFLAVLCVFVALLICGTFPVAAGSSTTEPNADAGARRYNA
jgi:hypothetical protein